MPFSWRLPSPCGRGWGRGTARSDPPLRPWRATSPARGEGLYLNGIVNAVQLAAPLPLREGLGEGYCSIRSPPPALAGHLPRQGGGSLSERHCECRSVGGSPPLAGGVGGGVPLDPIPPSGPGGPPPPPGGRVFI